MLLKLIQHEVEVLVPDDEMKNLYHAILFIIEHPCQRLMMGENACRNNQLSSNTSVLPPKVKICAGRYLKKNKKWILSVSLAPPF
jgi:hypothetical protein